VDVRLPVGHHDDLVAAELRAQQRAQAIGRPLGLGALGTPVFVLEVAQPGAQVSGKRCQFGAGIKGLSRPSPRMMARAPLTQPRQLSWATTTVITAMTNPSAAIRPIR
jgi:hypothetical protein